MFVLLVVVLFSVIYNMPGCASELFKLDLVHFNDFHSRFEETSQEFPICRFNNDSCLGGFPRLYHEIKVLLSQKPQAVVLNAGDSFQGTYWYTLLKWKITQHFMNLIPHDAHAIGNHDFDDGPAGLAPYLASLQAPALAANMDATFEPSLERLFKPHVIIERGGRRIGIIGLITPETEVLSSAGGVQFTDPFEATQRECQVLKEKGVDIIILLSHCGLTVDKSLAREFGKCVDIIVGGHSHRDEAIVPYPLMVKSDHKPAHTVMIVQAYSFTKFVGNMSIYFDKGGNFVKYDGGLIYLNRSIPEDKAIKKELEPYAKLVHEAENVVIGETLHTLSADDCQYGECTMADFLLDALVEEANRTLNSRYEHIAIVQRSQMKKSIQQGPITRGDVVELLPFYDKVISFELKGKHLLEALEQGVAEVHGEHPSSMPSLLQVSGAQVLYNISKYVGQRVVSVHVGSEQTPLHRDAYYQVTCSSYIGNGGEGFEMLVKERRNLKEIGYDQHIIEQYLRRHSPINISKGKRIEIY